MLLSVLFRRLPAMERELADDRPEQREPESRALAPPELASWKIPRAGGGASCAGGQRYSRHARAGSTASQAAYGERSPARSQASLDFSQRPRRRIRRLTRVEAELGVNNRVRDDRALSLGVGYLIVLSSRPPLGHRSRHSRL